MKNKPIIFFIFIIMFMLAGCQDQQITTINQTTLTSEVQNTTEADTSSMISSSELTTSITLIGIDVVEESIETVYTLSGFSFDDILLDLHFSDTTSIAINLDPSYVTEDISSISQAGSYTFNVEYLSFETSFVVQIIDDYTLTDISMKPFNPYRLISSFDIGDLELLLTYSDESQTPIPLTYEMLSSADINKLFMEGFHEITVNYQSFTTSFTIAMFTEYPSNETFELPLNASIFYEIQEMMERFHLSNPDSEDLYLGAIQGMIDSLDDPYTFYYNKDEFDRRQDGLSESYVGIGISISTIDDRLTITSVVNDGPADKAGLLVNDVIRYIRGVEVTPDNIFDIVNTLFGELGETLIIQVQRPGVEQLIEFQIQYEIIETPSVDPYTVQEGEDLIGVITVNSFGEETADLFDNAVLSLELESIDGLVIDLRDNGGGYLTAVVQMLRVFLLDNEQPILSYEAYNNGQTVYPYYGVQSALKPYNIVVLVNEYSASASEVFALGMQEHAGYKVVGMQTYGKGVGQTSLPISANPGDYLTITNAKWFGPNGTWVDKNGGTNGVIPDVIVQRDPLESLWRTFLDIDEVIAYDQVDPRLETIQAILNGMGYNVRTDGYYDIATQSAITDIQTLNGLDISGNINQDTLDVINQWLIDFQTNHDKQLDEAINQVID